MSLTAEQKAEIANLMFAETAKYINCYCINNETSDSTDMYCGDVMHNIQALRKFDETGDLDELYNTIMYQDTLVREHYIKVLYAIEDIKEENYEFDSKE